MQRIPAKTERGDLTGREALNDQIDGTSECQRELTSARMREVECQRSFVEIVEPEPETAIMMRQVIIEGTDAASLVAGGRLDLDHVGAHVGQQSRAQMSAMRAEIEHAQPRQRA